MKQIMLVKDMFLKNKISFISFYVFLFFFSSFKIHAETVNKTNILNYLKSLKYFSASFIQNDGISLSEGKLYIGKDRIRVEYFLPTKILIILDENKAMYYDYELEEDEFFNPKNTDAWFLYEIFSNPNFLSDSGIGIKKNEIKLKKSGFDNERGDYLINIFFENRPLNLRGFEVKIGENYLKISIYNHKYNQNFDKDFFKLINPSFLS